MKLQLLNSILSSWHNVQNALHCLEGMKQDSGRQSLIDRLHRDRGRQLNEINQPRQLDKRVSFVYLKSIITSPHLICAIFNWAERTFWIGKKALYSVYIVLSALDLILQQ